MDTQDTTPIVEVAKVVEEVKELTLDDLYDIPLEKVNAFTPEEVAAIKAQFGEAGIKALSVVGRRNRATKPPVDVIALADQEKVTKTE